MHVLYEGIRVWWVEWRWRWCVPSWWVWVMDAWWRTKWGKFSEVVSKQWLWKIHHIRFVFSDGYLSRHYCGGDGEEGGSWCTCSICHNLTWLFALCMLVYRHVMRVTGSNVSGWIEFNVQCMIHETSDEYTLNTWNINNVGVVTAISNWYSWRFIVLQGLNCMVCLSLHQTLTLACLFLTIIVACLICCV